MSNWSVHKAFEKATNGHSPTHLVSPVIRIYGEGEHIPIEAWEDALIKAANFVERWGKAYLPLFERVEYELEISRQQARSLERARNIASGELSYITTPLWKQSYFFEP